MLLNRLGILGLLATFPVLAQETGGPESPKATTGISPRQHGPMKFHGRRPDGTWESENWSGYAVTGSSFTQVLGSWTVPAVNCSAAGGTPNSYAAFWVGLDGWSSNTVEQTGTDSDCNGTSPSYYAWYEFYPKGSITITGLAIEPGDQIYAEVSYKGNEFTVTIMNLTAPRKYTYSKSEKVGSAKRSSAEWIAEAPCCTRGGGILPLSNFGIVDFGTAGADDATDPSTSGSIGNFGTNVQETTMVSSTGATEATPSLSPTTVGSSFTVTWDSE
jgi:hypothetical protein